MLLTITRKNVPPPIAEAIGESIYITISPDTDDEVDLWFTNEVGDSMRMLMGRSRLSEWIYQFIFLYKTIRAVETITDRDQLTLLRDTMVMVSDSTLDTTTPGAGAMYYYRHTPLAGESHWLKIFEVSLEDMLTWQHVEGKPTNTIEQIEQMVAMWHPNHINHNVLEGITEETDNLKYNGVMLDGNMLVTGAW